jgi:hypothetical protein
VPRTALLNPKTRQEEEEEREEIETGERGGTGGEGNPVQCSFIEVLKSKTWFSGLGISTLGPGKF